MHLEIVSPIKFKMKRNCQLILVFFLCILPAQLAFAQTPGDFEKLPFSSPNAASLGRYGEVPVGYYSGVPNISVPIHELVEGDISLPISISYHASGIKVEEVASWVGLGWSLNAGGLISVEVRGIPDMLRGTQGMVVKGLIQAALGTTTLTTTDHWTWSEVLDEFDFSDPADKLAIQEIKSGGGDGESDIYSVNAAGLNFKFFKNNEGSFMVIDHQDVSISYNDASFSWTIVDAQGIKYTFSEREISNSSSSSATTGWWLSEIEDKLGNQMYFHYTSYGSHAYSISQSAYLYLEGNGEEISRPSRNINTTYAHTYSSVARLDSITTESGRKVVFMSSSGRLDQENEFSLDEIRFLNASGVITNRAVLEHSYFQGIPSTPKAFENDFWQSTASYKRFKLNSITVDDKTFGFQYNEQTEMPTRYSISQDLWGYYNAAENITFIPYFMQEYDGRYLTFDGGDRTVNSQVIDTYMLRKITYPTGGYSEFFFEPNEIRDKLENGVSSTVKLEDAWFLQSVAVSGTCMTPFFTNEIDYTTGSLPMTFSFSPTASPPINWSDYLYIELVDAATLGGEYRQSIPVTGGQIPASVQPLPGKKYKLRMCGSPGTTYLNVSVTWRRPTIDLSNGSLMVNKKLGGLRIKLIKNFADSLTAPEIRRYRYYKQSDTTASSGMIVRYPLNIKRYNTWHSRVTQVADACLYKFLGQASFLMLTSYSSTPISLNADTFVGYSTVIEEIGSAGNGGKVVYSFSNVQEIPDIKFDAEYDFPPTPTTSFDFARGKLIQKSVFKSTGVSFVELERINNYYKNISTWEAFSLRGLNIRAGYKYDQVDTEATGSCQPETLYNNLLWRPYVTISGYSRLDSAVSRVYSDGNILKTKTEYSYSSPYTASVAYFAIKEKRVYQSNGSIMREMYKYPLDFTNITSVSGESQGLKKLRDMHILSPVVESASFLKNKSDADYKFLGSSYWEYYSDKPLRKNKFTIMTTTPLIDFSQATVTSGAVVKDSRYKLEGTFGKYTTSGKVQELQKANDTKVSYLWGYGQQYIVAEAVNASSNEIFYESFEEGNGNSTVGDSRTGKYSKTTGYNLTLSDLTPNKSYTLSYWRKVSGSWTLVLQTVNLTSGTTYSTTLTGQVDEIRFHPVDSQMSTYTFDPGIGATSVTSPASVTTYFQYDSFGRLQAAKDYNGNIQKSFLYHYKDNN